MVEEIIGVVCFLFLMRRNMNPHTYVIFADTNLSRKLGDYIRSCNCQFSE